MRIFFYALGNIIHNRWLSFSSLLVLTLLIFFINIFLFLIHGTDYFIETINQRITLSLNLKSWFTSEHLRVVSLFDDIQKTYSGVSTDYISASGALAILRDRDPDLAALIEDDRENPLPNTIQLENIPLDQYQNLNNTITKYQDIIEYDKKNMDRKLLTYRTQYDRILSIVTFLQSVQFSIFALVALFCFTVGIIVYLIIGNFIFFHRNEIRIIELVGGGNRFLYGPFVIQSAFYAFVATLLSTGLFFLLFSTPLLDQIFSTQDLSGFVRGFLDSLLSQLPLELTLFVFIASLSGWIAARKYTRKVL